eukprot:1051708-Prorocentrum_minimum.AAC.10
MGRYNLPILIPVVHILLFTRPVELGQPRLVAGHPVLPVELPLVEQHAARERVHQIGNHVAPGAHVVVLQRGLHFGVGVPLPVRWHVELGLHLLHA